MQNVYCTRIISRFHTLSGDLGGLWRRDAPPAQTLASLWSQCCVVVAVLSITIILNLQGMGLYLNEYSPDLNMPARGIWCEYITQGRQTNCPNVEIPIRVQKTIVGCEIYTAMSIKVITLCSLVDMY